jgi:hypothetical protein
MWNPSRAPSRSRWLNPARLVAGCVVLLAALSAYLLANAEIRAIALAPFGLGPEVAATAEPEAAATPELAGEPVAATTAAVAAPAAPVAARAEGAAELPVAAGATGFPEMQAQLDAMQAALAATAGQAGIAVPNPAQATPVPLVAPQPWTGEVGDAAYAGAALRDAEMVAAVAEIERLYAIMQPLMVQMQSATAQNRSASEQAALRAQMTDLHAQLNELIARVDQAKAQQGGAAPAPANPTTMPSVLALSPTAIATPTPDLAQMNALLDTILLELQTLVSSGAVVIPPAVPAVPILPATVPSSGQVADPAAAGLDQMLTVIEEILAEMQAAPVVAPRN